jgi:hypothetical protein
LRIFGAKQAIGHLHWQLERIEGEVSIPSISRNGKPTKQKNCLTRKAFCFALLVNEEV